MRALHRAMIIVLAALAVGSAVAWWRTAPDSPAAEAALSAGTRANEIADPTTYAIAQRLATLATESQEPALAQSAVRLADHDIDLAFASALRQLVARPPTLNSAANLIAKRLQKTQQLLDADQQQVAELTGALVKAAGSKAEKLQDQLDLAKSQVDLDQYELEEANQDLEEAGGNMPRRIEAAIQAHDAVEKAQMSVAAAAAPAEVRGLVSGIGYWRTLEHKRTLLGMARARATSSAAALAADRQRLAIDLETRKSGVADLAHHSKLLKDLVATTLLAPQLEHNHADAQAVLTQAQQISAYEQVLTLLDQRIGAQRDLANVYGQWDALVAARSRAQAHTLLARVTIVGFLILLLFALDRGLEYLLRSGTRDRRQVEMLLSISSALLQITAVLLLLVLLIGVPNQFGTMLGLIGAGLTVALKDFIIGFIGWFVLMGRNGVRLGDWVEINGVSGEVIELGLFRTALLETGNWGDAGNPTGRRVTFNNSFAIEGHYFNFSTSGQWLWDELKLVVPAGRDPHPVIDTLRKHVVAATAESARQAEEEWNRSVPTQPGRVFSGAPAVHVRPVVSGVELSVRYITRASDRFAVRAALNQEAVDLLGEHALPTPPSQGTASLAPSA